MAVANGSLGAPERTTSVPEPDHTCRHLVAFSTYPGGSDWIHPDWTYCAGTLTCFVPTSPGRVVVRWILRCSSRVIGSGSRLVPTSEPFALDTGCIDRLHQTDFGIDSWRRSWPDEIYQLAHSLGGAFVRSPPRRIGSRHREERPPIANPVSRSQPPAMLRPASFNLETLYE